MDTCVTGLFHSEALPHHLGNAFLVLLQLAVEIGALQAGDFRRLLHIAVGEIDQVVEILVLKHLARLAQRHGVHALKHAARGGSRIYGELL